RVPAGEGVAGRHVAGNLGGYHQPDVALAQRGQAHGGQAAVGLVSEAGFAGVEGRHGLGEVAVPLQGVHAQVE
nr:hypothetical protein [Tanacetum cinerariifolium]